MGTLGRRSESILGSFSSTTEGGTSPSIRANEMMIVVVPVSDGAFIPP